MSARNLRAAAERILGQAQNFAATSLPTTGEIPGIVSDLASQYGDWLGRGGGVQTLQEQGSRMFNPEAVRYVTQGGQRPAFASDDPDQVLGNVMDLVNPAGKAVGLLGHLAYHGSPHRFDRFDISKIGTGEGAQAYGHGLYFAENPKVAESYQETLEQMGNRLLKDPESDPAGGLYTVDIPDEWIPNMLDWDAPLSKQPESVQKRLGVVTDFLKDRPLTSQAKKKVSTNTATGEDLYRYLTGELSLLHNVDLGQARQLAAEALNIEGIPGIKYYDQASRGAGEGTRNFVTFGDEGLRILERR